MIPGREEIKNEIEKNILNPNTVKLVDLAIKYRDGHLITLEDYIILLLT